tara:strand:+ start:210 stop:1148 length:939 start_codon:yes stop_codon:yes gene_type:complete
MSFNKNLVWEANVHIYGLSLAIGDAHFLIDKIKSGDAYTDYFYNIDGEREGEPEGFVNEVENIIGKSVECFTLNKSGLGWFPIFASYSQGVDGYYIDFAGAENTPWFQRPECFFEKEHIKIINSMIEKSLQNKPIFELNFPSKRILFMETKDEVQFYTEDEIKVDYSKSTENVFNQLQNIYYNEYTYNKKKKIKFINAEHPTTEYTWDFHINTLSSNKFQVYKVESLIKDIDWYATYYAKYHTDQKDIYKRKTVSKEVKETMDEWTSRQPLGKEMKQILELANYDPNAPEIESFKMTVEQHGFLHGYYLKAV